METKLFTETTPVEAESLIGTKWVGWSDSLCDRMMIEFVDKKTCIYTSKPKEYPITYTVSGGKIFISHIDEPFELKGDVLFSFEIPAFKKAA